MRLTVVGCGDAFGSGGRANTCFWVECGRSVVALDFGATSLVEMKRRGLDHDRIDAIVLSHLHGDHFGALPFLLLDCQFARRRRRPLTIVGPVGTAERIRQASEVFFPGSSTVSWAFGLEIVDLPCGEERRLPGGISCVTRAVVHPSGAPATAVRLAHRRKLLAYSGDTSWTDALVPAAEGADLFIVDCYLYDDAPVPHGSFATIRANRERLGARRIMLTHMSDAMLGRMDEAEAEGFLVAHDGLVLDL